MGELLIATTNPRKIETYKKVLGNQFDTVTLKEIGVKDVPEENGKTLEENANLKAKFYSQATKMPAIADDAGFEIPALKNFPGTHSRRFLGHDMSDEEVISGILKKMDGLKGHRRQARMRVVVSLAFPNGSLVTESVAILGSVPEQSYKELMPHFPYRSLLYIDSLDKWFYDLTPEEEERLGYRIAAIEKIKAHLS